MFDGILYWLKELEDAILYKLANAEGDVLEDVELIDNLEDSKKVSNEISEPRLFLYSHGLYSHGLYSHDQYSYDLCSYGHILMAHIVMAHIVMAHIVMAHFQPGTCPCTQVHIPTRRITVDRKVQASVGIYGKGTGLYKGMACIFAACIVMAYIVRS